MSIWYEQAKDKLEQGAKEVKGRIEGAMKRDVKETLLDFCSQNEEFAQAVVQGGTFPECMAEVAKGVGSSISDEEAYTRAVSFYFSGARVKMRPKLQLESEDDIELCDDINAWAARNSDKNTQDSGGMLLDFSDFW